MYAYDNFGIADHGEDTATECMNYGDNIYDVRRGRKSIYHRNYYIKNRLSKKTQISSVDREIKIKASSNINEIYREIGNGYKRLLNINSILSELFEIMNSDIAIEIKL